jgi:hypothetical protein
MACTAPDAWERRPRRQPSLTRANPAWIWSWDQRPRELGKDRSRGEHGPAIGNGAVQTLMVAEGEATLAPV